MSCAPCAESGATCGGDCAAHVGPRPTTFGAASRLFTAPGLRGGLASRAAVRPAGDAASDEAARLAAEREADQRRREFEAGIGFGTTGLRTVEDSIAREQRRVQLVDEARTRERLAQIAADRDIELARLRGTATDPVMLDGRAPLTQRDIDLHNSRRATSPGAPEFSVLGLASTQGQVVNASPVAAQPAGVMGWIRENPVVVGIGVLGVAAAAFYALQTKSKGKRRR